MLDWGELNVFPDIIPGIGLSALIGSGQEGAEVLFMLGMGESPEAQVAIRCRAAIVLDDGICFSYRLHM